MVKFFRYLTNVGAITLISGASFLANSLPVLANNTRVFVNNSSCMTYNDLGEMVGRVQSGYYYLDRIYMAQDGRNYARIYADFSSVGKGVGWVNIPTSCLNNNGAYVIEY